MHSWRRLLSYLNLVSLLMWSFSSVAFFGIISVYLGFYTLAVICLSFRGCFVLTLLLLLLSVLCFVLGVTGICSLVLVIVTQACLVIFASSISCDNCVSGVLPGWSFWDISSVDLLAWPLGYVYHMLGIVVPDTSDTLDYCVFFIFIFLIFDLSFLSQYYFKE